MKLTLPTDSAERKDVPLLSGCMNYFPAALAWIARISLKGDRKHNPENKGPPFHARGKSMDHGDCIVRHTMDIEDLKADLLRGGNGVDLAPVRQLLEEAAYRAWRACADLQELCEKYEGAPLAPAARLPGELTFKGVPVSASPEMPTITGYNPGLAEAIRIRIRTRARKLLTCGCPADGLCVCGPTV